MSLRALDEFDGSMISDIWEKIGYDADEKEEEQKKIDMALIDALLIYQEKLGEAYYGVKSKIDVVCNDYGNLMRAFGHDEAHIEQAIAATQVGSLKEILANATHAFESFKECHKAKIDHIVQLHSECFALYEKLEIPTENRGEFDCLGDSDYTDARIERFAQELGRLHMALNERKKKLKELQDESDKLSKHLEIEFTPMNDDDVSSANMRQAEEALNGFNKMKAMREEAIEKKKAEITKLWNILDVPTAQRRKFTAKFKTIGASVIQAYTDEIEKLCAKRQENLPDIVKQQMEKIQDLEKQMHTPPEACETLEFDESDLNKVYEVLDEKLDRVQKRYTAMKPFLELIEQRKELMDETKKLDDRAKKVELLIKKKKDVDQKQITKDEQARRRIKSVLPRLEKKLLIMLIEYKTANGSDFMWDGAEYITQLEHIKLSDSELRQAQGGSARKKSLGTGRRTSQMSAVSAVTKGPVRRSLENNRVAVNK